MTDWFAANAGWVGPLVAVVLAVIGWRLQYTLRGKGQPDIRQKQRGGNDSTNVQVAGDYNNRKGPPDERK